MSVTPGYELVHTPQDFAVHWLQGVTAASPDDLLDYLHDHGCTHWQPCGGLHGYRDGAISWEGVRIAWNASTADMPTCLVVVPGAACETLGLDNLSAISNYIKITRVDLAWDHHELSPERLRWFWEHGYVRSRIRRSSYSWHENAEGKTFYMGAPGGTKRLVAYDRRGYNRLELRLAKEEASVFQQQGAFLGTADDLRELATSFLRRAVDFVEKNVVRSSDRALLPWWAAFVEDIQRAVVKLPERAVTTLETAFTWVREQVAPSLARLVDAFSPIGYDWLDAVISAGRERTQDNRAVQWQLSLPVAVRVERQVSPRFFGVLQQRVVASLDS